MLSFFKTNNPAAVLLYIPYMVLLRLFFWKSNIIYPEQQMPAEPLSGAIFGWVGNSTMLLILCGAVVQFIQALLINGLVNQNKMTARKTYLPGVIYILISSVFVENLFLNAAMIGLTFALGGLHPIFQLIKKEKMNGTLFDAGMLMGLAVAFHLPYIVLFLFLYLSLGNVRAVVIREWIVALLGFLTPAFLLFTVYFVADWPAPKFYVSGIFNLHTLTPAHQMGLGLMFFILAAALVGLQGALYSAVIQVRKFTTVLLLFALFVVLSFFLQENATMAHLMGLAVPVAVIGSMILVQVKRWRIAEVLHIILLLLLLAIQWLPALNSI